MAGGGGAPTAASDEALAVAERLVGAQAHITLKGASGEKIVGEVFSVEGGLVWVVVRGLPRAPAYIRALEPPECHEARAAQSEEESSGTATVRMLSGDQIASITGDADAPTRRPLDAPLPAVDQAELWRRMDTIGAACAAAVDRRLHGVEAKDELLFAKLEQYVPGRGLQRTGERSWDSDDAIRSFHCRWDGTSIVVADTMRLEPPFTPECLVPVDGRDSPAVERFRAIIRSARAELGYPSQS